MEHTMNDRIELALAGLLHLGLSPEDQEALGAILTRQYMPPPGATGTKRHPPSDPADASSMFCHLEFANADSAATSKENPYLTIGDLRPIRMQNVLFESKLWREHWKPGIQLHGYVAGCSGLANVAKPLGRAIAKFGTCELGRLTDRRRELGRQRYGSIYRSAGGYVHETGWDFWDSFPRLQVAPCSTFSPVRGSTESLIITCPQGMSAGRAEALINRALLRYSLHNFADCDFGRQVCAERGISADRLIRHSPGQGGSVVAASELLLLRPQADASRLASLIADVMVTQVLGAVPGILDF